MSRNAAMLFRTAHTTFGERLAVGAYDVGKLQRWVLTLKNALGWPYLDARKSESRSRRRQPLRKSIRFS
jgi:hypothetical protein